MICLCFRCEERLHLFQLGRVAGREIMQLSRVGVDVVKRPYLFSGPVLGGGGVREGAEQINEVGPIAEARLPSVVVNRTRAIEEVILRPVPRRCC
jgi:hypothetical protein